MANERFMVPDVLIASHGRIRATTPSDACALIGQLLGRDEKTFNHNDL
jgi:hypothetical protein